MERGMEYVISAVKWDMDSSARCPPLPQTRDLLKLQLCLIVSPLYVHAIQMMSTISVLLDHSAL